MGVTATEGVIGILSDAKGILGDIERFGKFSAFGKTPSNKAARERGGQDEDPETLTNQIAPKVGGIPAEILAGLDVFPPGYDAPIPNANL